MADRRPAPRPDHSRPLPLLFLIADTGGGHRAAAEAVTDALEAAYPGQFRPVVLDPLGGPGSSAGLRWVTGLYGPSIRLAPWTWGAIYYAADSKPMMAILRSTILGRANRPVAQAVATHQPAAIVSFHPLVGKAALKSRRYSSHWRPLPIMTVITDLVTPHTAWRYPKVDQIIAPSAAVRWRCHLDGIGPDRCHEVGLPVGASFASGPLRTADRLAMRRQLGLSDDRFLAVLTGGGEGSGGLARRAATLVKEFDDVEVVAICGRNERLQRRLARLSTKPLLGGRLVVKGFVDNMADWLRSADVVVTKAGPGTIAEATCCGAPLLVTSHVPGQERGNTEFVVNAGAGLHVPGLAELISEVRRLRTDPGAVDLMRTAAARISRPRAAADIAERIAAEVGVLRSAGGGMTTVEADLS